MGGTYTWRRDLPSGLSDGTWKKGNSTIKVARSAFAGTQVTTSYRSGAGSGSEGASGEDDRILSSKTYAERFQALRREYKDSGGGRPGDSGHPFNTETRRVAHSAPRRVVSSVNGTNVWTGPVRPDTLHTLAGGGRTSWLAASELNTGYYGPRAIAATMPTNPVSNLAVSLAEVKREGLPRMPAAATIKHLLRGNADETRKSLGGEYLNAEFGFKPLGAAIGETMHAVVESSRLLAQYQRDSGRMVRRSYTFPDEAETTVYPPKSVQGLINEPNAYEWNQGSSPACKPGGVYQESVTTTSKTWFTGAYTYFLQKDNSVLNKLKRFEQQANQLLGLRITPEVLWELQPWSWLVDWNLSVQDNIHNASALASDGLVIRYGFIMRTTVVTHTITHSGARAGNDTPLGPISSTFTTTRKQRVRANPYGFGSNPGSYTSRQWAILGALGMTKAPNVLGD